MPLIRQFSNTKYGNKYVTSGTIPTGYVYHNNKKYYQIKPDTGRHIIKLGYVCEPKGIGHKPGGAHADYPIFIYLDGEITPREIEVGKTFIYEADAPDNDIYISGVDVPVELEYTLDYILN